MQPTLTCPQSGRQRPMEAILYSSAMMSSSTFALEVAAAPAVGVSGSCQACITSGATYPNKGRNSPRVRVSTLSRSKSGTEACSVTIYHIGEDEAY